MKLTFECTKLILSLLLVIVTACLVVCAHRDLRQAKYTHLNSSITNLKIKITLDTTYSLLKGEVINYGPYIAYEPELLLTFYGKKDNFIGNKYQQSLEHSISPKGTLYFHVNLKEDLKSRAELLKHLENKQIGGIDAFVNYKTYLSKKLDENELFMSDIFRWPDDTFKSSMKHKEVK